MGSSRVVLKSLVLPGLIASHERLRNLLLNKLATTKPVDCLLFSFLECLQSKASHHNTSPTNPRRCKSLPAQLWVTIAQSVHIAASSGRLGTHPLRSAGHTCATSPETHSSPNPGPPPNRRSATKQAHHPTAITI
ncbi:uncharacterized protein B0I36DRAFT_148414 [Microdochium trichocladiopsis]|uniref:Uncharacterized protein n=1 Tax=Microdochium trichocladiopsis TaxID=1682393 RepID=A0A9P8Y214_9PEZI|nr:uncharacterized protein B0I36DRAFT_148414 [Microdochium trichocladiopsis]KAH7025718.1 hypothetical protein B0I36DRAFT_148414 [Microdochium trichocladiopsis]